MTVGVERMLSSRPCDCWSGKGVVLNSVLPPCDCWSGKNARSSELVTACSSWISMCILNFFFFFGGGSA